MKVSRCNVNELQTFVANEFAKGYFGLAVSVDTEKDIRVIEQVLEATGNNAVWEAMREDIEQCLVKTGSPAFVFSFTQDQAELVQTFVTKAHEGDEKGDEKGFMLSSFNSTSDIVRLVTQPELPSTVAVYEETSADKEEVKNLLKYIVKVGTEENGIHPETVTVVVGFGLNKTMKKVATTFKATFHSKDVSAINDFTNHIYAGLETGDRVLVIVSSDVNVEGLKKVLDDSKVIYVILKVANR